MYLSNDIYNFSRRKIFFSLFQLVMLSLIALQNNHLIKSRKGCIKCIPLIADHGLHDQKAFYKKKFFHLPVEASKFPGSV